MVWDTREVPAEVAVGDRTRVEEPPSGLHGPWRGPIAAARRRHVITTANFPGVNLAPLVAASLSLCLLCPLAHA